MGGLPLTEAALKQLPIGDRPSLYKAVPSDVATHANWWKSRQQPGGSAVSYPRTAVRRTTLCVCSSGGADTHRDWVWWPECPDRCKGGRELVVPSVLRGFRFMCTQVTDRGSVTPSEMALWESKMDELEKTLREERQRRQQ